MTASRFYSNNAQPTTLLAACNSSDTVLSLVSIVGFPASTPFSLVIDGDNSSAEVVTVTNVSGSSVTVLRGQDGTSAVSHGIGASVSHDHTARDWQDSRDHEAATQAHGATGAVVGTTNVQSLVSKTLLAATAGTVASVVKGAASQTANLMDWRDSANNVLASVDQDGNFQTRADVTTSTLNVAPLTDSVAILVSQFSGGTKNLFRIEDPGGSMLLNVDEDGNLEGVGLFGAEHVLVQPTDSANVALKIIKMDASSTDLVQVHDEDDQPLVTIDSAGDLDVVGDVTAATVTAQPTDNTSFAILGINFPDSDLPIFKAQSDGGGNLWRVDPNGFCCGPTTTGHYLRTNASYAMITLGGSEAIPDTTTKTVNLDTLGAGTTDEDMVNLGANRLIAPRDGLYDITASVMWEADDEGYRVLRIVINDSARQFSHKKKGAPAWAGAGGDPQVISRTIWLAAGDYVTAEVTQNSGHGLTLTNVIGPWDVSLSMGWVSP